VDVKALEEQLAALTMNLQHQLDVTKIKEEGNNRRKLMDVISRAYNTDTINEAKVNQSNIKAVTDQNKMELDAMVRLVLAGLPAQALAAEIDRRDQEQRSASAFAEMEVNQTQNPFIQAGQELMAPPPMQPMQPPMQPMPPEMQGMPPMGLPQ